MTEILAFVISGITACFNVMRRFFLENNGLPSLFDLFIVLIVIRIILYIKAYIQSTTELESDDFTESDSYLLSRSSPYVKLHRQKYKVPRKRR